MKASSVGALPRNREQVANICRTAAGSQVPLCSKKGIRDPLFMVMEQSKLCEAGDKFVRVVTASPEPMCVLATDQQVEDLVRFAANPRRFSVISIDPTFSLGEFSVTCIAYRHLLVMDPRTRQSPILLGPILVHQRKKFETYHFFASTLVGLNANVLAFGTDGEEALVKAFKQQLPSSIHLRCFRHMKQDIQRKLRDDMGFADEAVEEITAQIFGVKSGPTFHEGLVDSNSERDFMSKLERLEPTWSQLSQGIEKMKKNQVSFYQWFLRYHTKEVIETMLRPVREAAGLGDPPSEFCTNDSESINSSLKHFLAYKKSGWPVFNDKIRKFVSDQQEEVCKAVVGLGECVLRSVYEHFRVLPSRWFTTFTEEQKTRARRRFQKASVDDAVHVQKELRVTCCTHPVVSGQSSCAPSVEKESYGTDPVASAQSSCAHSVEKESYGTDPVASAQSSRAHSVEKESYGTDLVASAQSSAVEKETRTSCHADPVVSAQSSQSLTELTVSIEEASTITGLPSLVVRQVWEKAVDLLSSTGQVNHEPGCSKVARMVASRSQQKPHFVSVTSDGPFVCDDQCPGFQQRCICSHCVATAEHNGMLKEFLQKYGTYAKTAKGKQLLSPNFTRLSMANLPLGTAGRKGGKPPKKTAVSRRPTVPDEQRQQLIPNTPAQTNSGLTPASDSTASGSMASHSCQASPLSPPFPSDTPCQSDQATPRFLGAPTSFPNWNWYWLGAQAPSYGPIPPYLPPISPYSPSAAPYGPISPYSPSAAPSGQIPPYSPPAQNVQNAVPPRGQPLADVTNNTHYPYRAYGSSQLFTSTLPSTSPTRSTTIPPSTGGQHPFIIKFLNGRINVCAGCRGPHPKGVNGELLPPPHNICVMHTELLSYVNPRTGIDASKVGNANYHINSACIRKKHPNFTTQSLRCPQEVRVLLTPDHCQLLCQALGFTV